jgi:hypothetical protein
VGSPYFIADQPMTSVSNVSRWTLRLVYGQATGGRWSAIAVAAVAAIAVAAGVAFLDGFIFPTLVFPVGYADMLARTSTLARLAYFVPRAVAEEVVFRGVGVSALAWLGRYFCKRRVVLWWLAIAAAQCINLALALPAPSGWLVFLYDGVRYFAPGLVWGWLFWRYGILAAAGAHAGAQLLIQPVLTMLYQH